MTSFNFFKQYRSHVANLFERHDDQDEAYSLSVGGNFEAMGLLEYYLLLAYGLKKEHAVVDVGCGSGRLAFQLKDYLSVPYIGIDVVPELYRHAEKICGRSDWRFYTAPGVELPEPEQSADFICFFSVFTHLTHEETFLYLKEAARVLKPDGKIVFSFLEFSIPYHYQFFKSYVEDNTPDKVLTQFICRDAIRVWAENLNLSIFDIQDGDKPHIPLLSTIHLDDGNVMMDKGNLGQSVCILQKEPP